jgi:hypothetical protein
MTPVYRIQDRDGRGPYRPGFSHKWSDAEGPILPTIFEDFGPNLTRLFARPGHYGCAFLQLDQARTWFSKREAAKLAALGFSLVEISDAEIVASAPRQVLIRRDRPLHRKVRKHSLATLHGSSSQTPASQGDAEGGVLGAEGEARGPGMNQTRAADD